MTEREASDASSASSHNSDVDIEEEPDDSKEITDEERCICGQGYGGRFMLDCDKCHFWFHSTCVGIDRKKIPKTWHCPNCTGIKIELHNRKSDRVAMAKMKETTKKEDGKEETETEKPMKEKRPPPVRKEPAAKRGAAAKPKNSAVKNDDSPPMDMMIPSSPSELDDSSSSDADFMKKTTKGRGGKKATTGKTRQKVAEVDKSGATRGPAPKFNAQEIMKLAKSNPDHYFSIPADGNMMDEINDHHPLKLQHVISHQGAFYCMRLSPDFKMLATCTNLGAIQIWNTTTWKLVIEMRDRKEKHIEEFFVLSWSEDGRFIIAGGKLKSRTSWSLQDEDCHILPCPLKVFNITSGEVVETLHGHEEEILCLKRIKFDGETFLISGSEDGRMIKWKMNRDYGLVKKEMMDDLTTNMVISLTFVPDCGNRYYLASSDTDIKLFDFQHGKMVASWPNPYSYLCDSIEVVCPRELECEDGEYFVLSKGVELVDEENSSKVTQANKCTLHKLTMPGKRGNFWEFEIVDQYAHDEYQSNLWLMRLATNGRYVASPTTNGKVFLWNLRSKELAAVIRNGGAEIRDILFHPQSPLLLTCDSRVYVWDYDEPKVDEAISHKTIDHSKEETVEPNH
ncbi:hypothetical protein PROFUN_10230 [Planoprotostelium fungivorum]|uniref:PHD-type domain-containing protein n=1 Tax=Planoprotostelium fungivorum TaxID=1890364 RepID=A0A2P6NED8_9EUKA|nr:hypothetical protein PROFUN_10230 [Planoprotostelium fungivorum]